MIEKLNEKVDVITVYKKMGAKVFPYKVRWNGREYLIKKLGYHHKVKQGKTLLHYFSVSSDTIAFRLKFDTDVLSWTLEEVSDGLAA